jgi:cell division protease FtsH
VIGRPSGADAESGRGVLTGRGPLLVLGGLLVFLLVTYGVVLNALRPHTPGREITLGAVFAAINDRSVTDVTLLAEDSRLIGSDDQGAWWAALGNNAVITSNVVETLIGAGVSTRIDPQVGKGLLRLATQFALPTITLVVGFAFIYTLFRGSGKDLSRMGRAGARRYVRGAGPSVTFKDVAGLDEAIEELREVKDFLAAPQTFAMMGAKPPRGILLAGPPGTGKTLLARAVAGEAGVPFFSVSASEFTEMLVGVGPARVRDLFRQARAAAPSIVFVDELDAVGRARSTGATLNAEAESTLNELLVQLDGFDTASQVVLMAATNRPDVLDRALLRKGRFDRQIVVDPPDLAGRLAILRLHARGKPLGPDADLQALAQRTVGFTGADLAATMNEAAVLAVRRRAPRIGRRELSEAVERVLAGPERRSRILSPQDKPRVAVHEAGHALVAQAASAHIRVEKVTIVARGHSVGTTWSLPVEDPRMKTRAQIEDDIMLALAGRAAEYVVFGDVTGGAADDLRRAARLARQMVCELGMSDALGPLVLDERGDGAVDAPELSGDAAREIRRVLDEADQRAQAVLAANRRQLERLAELLVQQETLEREQLEDVLADVTLADRPERKARRKVAKPA